MNMNETEKKQELEQQEPEQQEAPLDFAQLNSVERFYERFRGISLRKLDIFIGVCVAVLLLVILMGVLDSHGIF